MKSKTLLLLFILIGSLVSVTGLTCYTCIDQTTKDTANCTDGTFDRDAKTVNRVICPFDAEIYCLKVEYNTTGGVYRQCTSWREHGEAVCDYWLSRGASYCSTCTTDLCNSAVPLAPPSAAAALLLSLLSALLALRVL